MLCCLLLLYRVAFIYMYAMLIYISPFMKASFFAEIAECAKCEMERRSSVFSHSEILVRNELFYFELLYTNLNFIALKLPPRMLLHHLS